MKILHVLPKYRHSNWQKKPNMEFYSFDNITWYQSIVEKYGAIHKIIPFWWDVAMIERGKKAMNRKLLELVAKEKPNFVFFNIA